MQRAAARASEDGAVVVEFAAVFVIFVALLAGLIQYGVIFGAQQSVTHAAAEAGRAAVGMQADELVDEVETVLQRQLTWLDDDIDDIDDIGVSAIDAIDEDHPVGVYYSVRLGESCLDCVDVAVKYQCRSSRCPIPELYPVPTPSSLAATASVKYQ